MNDLYKELFKIIVVIIAIHYIPDWWIHILFAVVALFLVEFANTYSRKYALLKWLQRTKEKIRKYKMRKELDKLYKDGERDKIQKEIIKNALEKAKSIDESERETGLKQLSQFGTEDTYEKLLEVLKNGLDKSHEKQIVGALCQIFNNMKNMNKC